MAPLSGNSSNDQTHDFFQAFDTFESGAGKVGIYRLSRLEDQGLCRVADLPFSIRVMLESVLRQCDGNVITQEHVKHLAAWQPKPLRGGDIPFKPARVILQDFTGVPAIVDLAAMRAAMKRLGGDPRRINPLVPVDLVIDHSVQVDRFASDDALQFNVEMEFHRNRERYEFLRWGQRAFDNFRVVPPETGIVHQVNLEYLSKCVLLRNMDGRQVALPDTLVGTDSHTTMINGLGIVGWGVGGIEAEAAMLGQPLYMLTPEVIGFELTGQFTPGVTATDLVLTVAQMLRKHGVVGRFVEFFGSGLANLQTADRATIGNMSPEYGATIAYFPIDDETLHYLRSTGRTEDEVQLVERYAKEQGLFHADGMPQPKYSDCLKLDLATVEPSLSGPKRPHDRVALASLKQSFADTLRAPIAERGFALKGEEISRQVPFSNGTAGPLDHAESLGHGSVVIAAITSCTNTSNPTVMLAAGLLAKKAVEKGLHAKPHVKTSLAPGSRVVSDYLDRAGLTSPLKALGFHTVGYGCTTCIGNSGPLPEKVAKAVTDGSLVAAAVLSGNRNFEGRIHSLVKANYLASPPLVVAFALAGRIDIDLTTEPLGLSRDGQPVYLRDLWPAPEEVARVREQTVLPEMFRERYSRVFEGNERWNELKVGGGDLYDWDGESTYIQEPPFFIDLPKKPAPIGPLHGARILALLGDSITTDHISPAGAIAKDSPAGRYLQERGVEPREFNSYGSRRGNDRVMTRGTFANVRIRNQLAPGTEGGLTRHLPDGEVMSIFDASVKYRAEGVPLVILAGAEYGSGSSRDWAAKGTNLLGVKAVIATSYERIHRSNLVGMGVLPLQFRQGETWQSLGLTGEEVYDIDDLGDEVKPLDELTVTATAADGTRREFAAVVRVESPIEIDYYRHGGILQAMLREMLEATP